MESIDSYRERLLTGDAILSSADDLTATFLNPLCVGELHTYKYKAKSNSMLYYIPDQKSTEMLETRNHFESYAPP